ncbi:MAG: SDR family NAD(P)-dependent oxidoreductase [Oscillospiraceae bacterium]
MNQYEGKVALVTGAGNGMGKELFKVLLERGAKVIAGDIEEDSLFKAAEEFKDLGSFITCKCNVANEEEVKAMVNKGIEAFGKIDSVFSNAGVLGFEEFDKMPIEMFDRQININCRGTFYVCQAAARAMIEKGTKGSILITGSFQSEWCNTKSVGYAASKGAVKQMAKAMALDLAPYGIRVNCIGPGYAITRLTDVTRSTEGREAALLAKVPMGRGGDAHEIACAMAALNSDDFSYMTGSFVPVDGGWSAM